MTETDPQAAEFDTVAEWTAEAARALGPDHRIPAACRGSGGPAALDWLIEQCGVTARTRLLDVGAGVGGPAAYAARQTSVRPLLVEPQPGACRAARRLFGAAIVRGDATALPVADRSCDAIWSIGVVDTVADQVAHFAEIRRSLAPCGAAGVLAYVATGEVEDAPETNTFLRRPQLLRLIGEARLAVAEAVALTDLPATPDDWQRRADEVDAEVARRHGDQPVWRQAHEQERAVARLLSDGRVAGELFLLRPE
jgi:SAM-dependent methyltransferase